MKIVTKILSILCLVAVLACAFVPCIKLTGNYQESFSMINSISAYIPEEAMPMIEQVLEMQGITIDIKGTVDSFSKLLDPINDGEITIMDFVTVSQNCTEVANALSGLPKEGLGLTEDNPMAAMLGGINEMVVALAALGSVLPMLSYILLIPVGLFAILAFFVVLRIILRAFGRRGLGVGITFLAILNAAFMIGLPVVVTLYAGAQLSFGLETTNVPYIIVGCCIVNCILWAIGRGPKVKKVAEAPVETPVVEETSVVEETPVVEEVVAEEVVEETPVVEEETTEE